VTRLLLDTTFLIDAEHGAAGLDDVIADDDDVAIAAITIAELSVGVLLADGRRRATRAEFVAGVLAGLPAVDYDSDVAEVHADLLAHVRQTGSPRGAHDLIIAATARATGRAVVTADRSAFEGLPGVQVHLHRCVRVGASAGAAPPAQPAGSVKPSR
jgi:tRNA(fMet)-specific endonuclease VapC